MIANGVPVTFDFALILSIFALVAGGGYAVIWGLNKVRSLFFSR